MNIAAPLARHDDSLFVRAVAIVEVTRGKTRAAGAAFLLDEMHTGSAELRDAILLALFAEVALHRERAAPGASA